MNNSIQKQISKKFHKTVILLLVISLFLSVAIAGLLCHKYISDISNTAADFASAVINADEAKNYSIARKTDDSYMQTKKRLESYAENNSDFIVQISLIAYNSSSGYYIYDTTGNDLGAKIPYDNYTTSVKAELINGKNRWTHSTAQYLYSYAPLRTVDDKLAGYIVIKSNNTMYISSFAAAFIVLIMTYGLFRLLLKKQSDFLENELFAPMRSIAKTALAFTGSASKKDVDTNAIFLIDKDNEVGHLSKAIQKMISDINNSTENLSNAIYEATHDGMTKVFNKRHYDDNIFYFKVCSSICTIYFDVNNLKLMNDTLGHERGDYVIKRAAEYITEICSGSDAETMCFRMGGDEFLLIMTNCSYSQMDYIIERVESDCPYILSAEEDSVKCALSYGFAYANGAFTYEEVLAKAEENMYKKKTELKQQLNMPDR